VGGWGLGVCVLGPPPPPPHPKPQTPNPQSPIPNNIEKVKLYIIMKI